MKVNRILVPTDFSEASTEAIKMANHFIELFDCTVDLLHVVPLLSYFDESMEHLGVPFDMEKDLYPHAMQTANKKLHDIAEKYVKPKEHCGKLINLIGRKPSHIISEKANSGTYDFIIMTNKGSHDTGTVRSSITEKVIRYSEIPVLSIDKAFSEDDIHSILVPLDGSEESVSALAPGFELARIFNAQLHLMHIVEPYTFGMETLPPIFEDDEKAYLSVLKRVEEYLEHHEDLHLSVNRSGVDFEDYLVYNKGASTDSIPVQTIIKKGFSAHSEICDYANTESDLVIMSTHGRTGVARILLGSTTGAVAQHLEKPLLTLHPG